jgi:ABC-type glycerol-3-phosphate transport system permease component
MSRRCARSELRSYPALRPRWYIWVSLALNLTSCAVNAYAAWRFHGWLNTLAASVAAFVSLVLAAFIVLATRHYHRLTREERLLKELIDSAYRD